LPNQTVYKSYRYFITVLLLFGGAFFSCSYLSFVESIPPEGNSSKNTSASPRKSDTTKAQPHTAHDTVKQNTSAENFDFALALTEGEAAQDPIEVADRKKARNFSKHHVFEKKVRIQIADMQQKATLYSVGRCTIRNGSNNSRSVRGRIVLSSQPSTRKVSITDGNKSSYTIALPCTLLSQNSGNYLEISDNSYRGSLIIRSPKTGFFSLINYLDVEEYLRGVVPLEIGKLGVPELEAMKAQAIAARTYTYLKMALKKGGPFDLLPTVADQVYGGVNAEYTLTDRAIRETADMIMTYQGALVYAYYHSTCAGATTNIEQVWDKPAQPYLVSRSDTNSQTGEPYCSMSKYSSWTSSWPTKTLSSILARNGASNAEKGSFGGTIKDMRIIQRYPCRRIQEMSITSTKGTLFLRGDKTRFALRRNVPGYPILPSSRFSITECSSRRCVVKGAGYGHGVGMCQMGAIGRARSGQKAENILMAYYSGITISQVRTD